jgi:hypothetical protein
MQPGSRFVFVLLLMASCVDSKDYNIHAVNVNPVVALPLVHGNLSVADIINDKDSSFIKINSDDLISVEYSKPLISTQIRDLFNIPDKAISQSFPLFPGVIPAHPKDIHSDSVTEVIDLALSPAQLNKIDFKTGTINFSTSVLPATSALKFEVIFSSTNFISKTTGKTLSIVGGTGSAPMSDYTLTLVNNKFNLKLVLVLKGPAAITPVGANSSISMKFSMAGMDFNSIQGFFGDRTVFPPAAVLDITAFGNSLHNADVSFPQAQVLLNVINDYGVPTQIDFLTFEVHKDGAKLDGQLNPASPLTINHPTVLGTSATTPVEVKNALQLITFGPNSFNYSVSARINKGLTTGNNFLADTSKLRVNLDVKIPLYGHASKILLADTAALDFGKISQSQINHASLKVNIVNQLPLEAKLQIYLADAKYKVLDSLLTAQTTLIKGSSITASGDLDVAGVADPLIILDDDALGKLFAAKYIIIKSFMNTSRDAAGNSVDVKFKSKYSMQVNVGLLADLKFNVTF